MSKEAPWEDDPAAVQASQSEVRKVDNAIDEKATFSQLLGTKNLSTRDKELHMDFFVPTHEQLANERSDLTLANIDELEKEIKRTKDPKVKQVLVEEHERMKTSFANILGIK